MKRCDWAPENDVLYCKYHDEEWGVPVHDDRLWFEFLILETFQAGLSWRTVLYKRENFRKAFDGFYPEKIAQYTAEKMEELRQDAGIIRNRLKIKAAVNNARAFLDVASEFGSFDKYMWGFVDEKPICNEFKSLDQIPASTPLSDKISKDLRNRGFKFVGSTVVYAHMQATGLVNDHQTECFRRQQVKE